MAITLSWLTCAALLSAGGFLLRHAARDHAASWVIRRRLRERIAPMAGTAHHASYARRLLEWLGRVIMGAAPARQAQDLLLRAGIMHPAAPYIFAGTRFATVIAAFCLVLALGRARHGAVTPQTAAAAFFLGLILYRAFSIALKMRAETRQREIRRELPYVLDLILMVLDSGVSIDQALNHVSSQIGNAAPICGDIFARYIAETDEGLPYDMALDRLSQRLAINEGRDFAGILKQNLFQGGELSPPLQRLAADIGETRLATAREQIGRKSVLLTFVTLAFFVPVLMIALAGPAVSDLMGTLHNVSRDLSNQNPAQTSRTR